MLDLVLDLSWQKRLSNNDKLKVARKKSSNDFKH
jgi:hypothetical protein